MKRTLTPENKHIAILWGGDSGERLVSAQTADAISDALLDMAYTPHLIDLCNNWQAQIYNAKPGFVFIAAHGGIGEDGTVQHQLELLGYPYNGSGVMACSFAWDKGTAKEHFAAAGLDVAGEIRTTTDELPMLADETPTSPMVVKPAQGGSTQGITLVDNANDWPKAHARLMDANATDVLLEEYIPGRELTVAVLEDPHTGPRVLGVMEITLPALQGIYTEQQKYDSERHGHRVPTDLPEFVMKKLERDALAAHKALGCRGLTRIDFRYDEASSRLVALELNALPGLTPSSLCTDIAARQGYSMSDLIHALIQDGLWQQQHHQRKTA